MKSTQDIVDSIDTRLRELVEEITALNAARSALDASEHEPSRHPSRRTPTRLVHPRTENARTPASARTGNVASRQTSDESITRWSWR
jgi:hypothetical protein